MAKKRSRKKSVDAAIGLVISNIDLLTEIFLRLPAKSLIRFKLVCKTWLSFISDTEFGITHSRRNVNTAPVSLLYSRAYDDTLFISLNGRSSFPSTSCLDPIRLYSTPNFRIGYSCNGLILLKQVGSSNYVVLNPTTQKYRLIIASDSLRSDSHSYEYSESLLAFEPLQSQHYKAVILYKISSNSFVVHIFCSQSGTWKDFEITTTPGKCCTRKIYWNGSIHWLHENNFYLQFDIDAEKLIETPLPPNPRILGEDKIRYFGESNGRLFLIQCHRAGAPGFRMLEMDMNTHSWSIKHQINLRPLSLQFPMIQRALTSFFPRCISKRFEYYVVFVKIGDDMKSFSLVLIITGNIVLYEVKKGKSYTNANVIRELPISTFSWNEKDLMSNAQPFMESLAPV